MALELMRGNEAIAEGAIRAGCRFYAGYPITPQNELFEYMAKRMPQAEGIFLQCESEVAGINMIWGAACTGTRAMTSSSGPGISLMSEGLTTLAAGQLPCVMVDVTRAGPGLGRIAPAQSDYRQVTKGGGHGDYHAIVLGPASTQEMAEHGDAGLLSGRSLPQPGDHSYGRDAGTDDGARGFRPGEIIPRSGQALGFAREGGWAAEDDLCGAF